MYQDGGGATCWESSRIRPCNITPTHKCCCCSVNSVAREGGLCDFEDCNRAAAVPKSGAGRPTEVTHRGYFTPARPEKTLLRLPNAKTPNPYSLTLEDKGNKLYEPMQALADLLKVTHRGYFIPPRPEKNPVEGQRAQQEFVEQRRAALQHYLEQLAAHPIISRSEVGRISFSNTLLYTPPLGVYSIGNLTPHLHSRLKL